MKITSLRFIGSVVIGFMLINLIGCASLFDRWINDITIDPPYTTKPEITELHQQLLIVDLHADPLLWNRDLLERNSYGHVDVPRLQEGNVTLQVFGVVTGVPFPISMENNHDQWDLITLLSAIQNWPVETQDSRLQRALYQAEKLRNSSTASQAALRLIKTRTDLEDLLNARNQGQKVIGALLSLEGAHALEGDPANINVLFDAGFRMLGLVHLMDNDMAGSAHGVRKHGLTDKGRQLVERALSLGMVIDLAHASEQTINDVLQMSNQPVVASHGGVRATCDTARNLEDRHIQAIAKNGGIIGIGLYEYATCGTTMSDTVRAIRHIVKLVGIEHVALGSEFDGATETLTDVTGLILLTEALRKDGFNDEEINAIMGINALRVLRTILPQH